MYAFGPEQPWTASQTPGCKEFLLELIIMPSQVFVAAGLVFRNKGWAAGALAITMGSRLSRRLLPLCVAPIWGGGTMVTSHTPGLLRPGQGIECQGGSQVLPAWAS